MKVVNLDPDIISVSVLSAAVEFRTSNGSFFRPGVKMLVFKLDSPTKIILSLDPDMKLSGKKSVGVVVIFWADLWILLWAL